MIGDSWADPAISTESDLRREVEELREKNKELREALTNEERVVAGYRVMLADARSATVVVEVPEISLDDGEEILRSLPAGLPAWEDGNWPLLFSRVVEFLRSRPASSHPDTVGVSREELSALRDLFASIVGFVPMPDGDVALAWNAPKANGAYRRIVAVNAQAQPETDGTGGAA